jgi:hypothetical protein
VGDEALPLVGDPRRGEGVGGCDEHELVAPVEARLELRHPGATAREVGSVQEDLPRPAGGREAGLEVLLEGLDPRSIAVGIAQKRGVAIGHARTS